MDEQRLWAPWRLSYITGDKVVGEASSVEPTTWRPAAEPSCFMCWAAAEYADDRTARRQNLVVAASEEAVAILNRYPYNNGHLLVCPRRHVGDLHELTLAEHLAAMQMLGDFTQRYAKLILAEGFNIGLNLGRVAGAGVPGHLHWHLVPRWTGDGNFMPTITGTRVISQSIEELWEAIAQQED